MAVDYGFAVEELVVDEGLGYPRAYAKICRDRSLGPYNHGPPFTFTPYALQQNESLRAKELEQMFPVIDPKAKPTAKPKIFINLLWKQLSHLGNAGFDPEEIRVDPYGNVLYYHADSASPLSWDIDHWFPCSKGENEEINSSQTVESHSFPQHFMQSKEQIGLAPAAVVVSRKELYDSSSTLKALDYNRQMIRPQSPIIAARKMKPLKENENPDFVTNPYQAIVMARDSLKQREETHKMQTEIQKLDEEVNEMRRKNDEEKISIQDLEVELIKRRRRAEKCRRLAEAQSSYRTMLEKMIRDAMHQSVVYKEQVRLNQAAANALMARLEAQKAICDAAEKELHKKFKQRDELEKQIRPEWEHARKRSRMDDTFFEGEDSKSVLYLPGLRPRTPSHKELRVFLEEEQKASVGGLSSNEDQKHEEIEEELAITVSNAIRDKREEHDKAIAALEDEKSIEQKFQSLEIEEERQESEFPVVEETEKEEDEESRKQRGKGNVERWLQMLLENTQEELDPQNEDAEVNETDEIIKKLDSKYPQKEKETVTQIREKDVRQKKEEIAEIGGSKTPRRRSYAWEAASASEGVGIRKERLEKEQQALREKDVLKKKEENAEIENSKATRRSSYAWEGPGVSEGVGSRKERTEKNGKERNLMRSESARAFRRIPSSPSLILGMKKRSGVHEEEANSNQ
ncbi:hypothetical protein COLO4_12857 [Corchorus olitorius]|uniref:Uncharacterized protein n=1 Tax=Corchorus olitorius TaxID=93759 RepID=A0A1R3JZB9_9ROSI|nr:hypothetical protein COLO4_12857 [Corchorus olitorius]